MKAVRFLPLVIIAFLFANVQAQNTLIVEENGIAPFYSSIQAALNDAVDGDVIIIKNKPSGDPYAEDVLIDKCISLLPYYHDSLFHVKGEYTIEPSGGNFSGYDYVTIIGMENDTGDILAINNPFSSDIKINIMGSVLLDGSINFDRDYIPTICGNEIHGVVIVNPQAGTIAGNILERMTIQYGGPTTDSTFYIVGNRITSHFIQWSNDACYFYIANNHVYNGLSTPALLIYDIKSGTSLNIISNNSFEHFTTGIQGRRSAIYIEQDLVSTKLLLVNNALHDAVETGESGGTNNEYAIEFGSTLDPTAEVQIMYTLHDGYLDGFTNATPGSVYIDGNIEGTDAFDLDNTTGAGIGGEGLNKGHPGGQFTDLDLTRNDIGVEGGSFNYSNFFPILTGSARMCLLHIPRVAYPGTNVDVSGDAYAR